MTRCTVQELEKHQICQEELITRALKEATEKDPDGKIHIQCTAITDCSGMGRAHMYRPGFDALKRLLWITDRCYPERLKKLVIVNAPWIFGAIWLIVKHFIDPVTREKIQIYNYPETERLLEWIDADQLPTYLGGSHPLGDANPPIRNGGAVPSDCPKSAAKIAEEESLK